MMVMHWKNPFESFLNSAHSEMRKVQPEPEVRTDGNLLPRFVTICERRNFVFDVVDRIEVLSTAFERLRELYESYVRFDSERWSVIDAQRVNGAPRDSFEYPDELGRALDRCHREAQALVTFAYYELSTLAALLRHWISPPPQSQLEYLIAVRNKLLTHPRRDARTKRSRSALTIGPILIPHLVGAESWNPLLRDWYLEKLAATGVTLDDEAGAKANVALILDPSKQKRTERLNAEETLQLKAYVVPEPDLLQSASEMASLLETQFLPEVTHACTERVK